MLFPYLFITTTSQWALSDYSSSGENPLQETIHLVFLKRSPSVILEPVATEDLADGNVNYATEKVSLLCGTFRVDIITLAFLQSFDRQMVYGYLFDPNRMNFITSFFALRLSISILAKNDESAIINLSASKEDSGMEAYGHNLLLEDYAADFALISGTVYDVGGTTPLPGVQVNLTATSYCNTDAYGRFYFLATPGTSHTFTLTRSGKTFPTGQTLTPPANQESIKNFIALT